LSTPAGLSSKSRTPEASRPASSREGFRGTFWSCLIAARCRPSRSRLAHGLIGRRHKRQHRCSMCARLLRERKHLPARGVRGPVAAVCHCTVDRSHAHVTARASDLDLSARIDCVCSRVCCAGAGHGRKCDGNQILRFHCSCPLRWVLQGPTCQIHRVVVSHETTARGAGVGLRHSATIL